MEKIEEDRDKRELKIFIAILVTTDGAIHLCAPTMDLRWRSRQTLDEGLMGILVSLSLTKNAIVGWGRHP